MTTTEINMTPTMMTTYDNECFCQETEGVGELIALPCKHRIHLECTKKMITDQCPWCRTPMGIRLDIVVPPVNVGGGGGGGNFISPADWGFRCRVFLVNNIIMLLYVCIWGLLIQLDIVKWDNDDMLIAIIGTIAIFLFLNLALVGIFFCCRCRFHNQ